MEGFCGREFYQEMVIGIVGDVNWRRAAAEITDLKVGHYKYEGRRLTR